MRGAGAMPRRSFLVGGLGFLLAGCGSRPRDVTYRFTLEVETPEGRRIGSNLLEVGISFNDGPLGGLAQTALSVGVSGEATVVDLGARGLLFCLLSRDIDRKGSLDQDAMFGAVFPERPPPGIYADQRERDLALSKMPYRNHVDRVKAEKPTVAVPIERLPRLVRFRDLSDPLSVETVDPRDLATVFGPGVRLVGATVAITEGKPTRGIEKILPWVLKLEGSIGKNVKADYWSPLGQINDGSFRRRWS
jgi:hypothetical protein